MVAFACGAMASGAPIPAGACSERDSGEMAPIISVAPPADPDLAALVATPNGFCSRARGETPSNVACPGAVPAAVPARLDRPSEGGTELLLLGSMNGTGGAMGDTPIRVACFAVVAP